MSAIKTSQIHDGFATIRSRGLQRSRSRVEQLERLKPMSMKCDSMPLYENPSEIISANNNNNNNNNTNSKNKNIMNGIGGLATDHQVVYKFESFTGLTETSPTSEALQNEAKILKNVDDMELNAAKTISCGTFKCSSNSQLSTSDHGSSIETNDRSSLPPPSPCYETYSNSYHSPKLSPDHVRNSSQHSDYFLYSRPTSPLYETYVNAGLSGNSTNVSSSPEAIAPHESLMYSSLPPSSKLFTTSYYTRSDSTAEYALQKIGKKPTVNFGKTQSLQYRKSYSHPTHTIFENAPASSGSSLAKYDHGIRNYYNSTTNYYDPSEMSYIGSYTTRQSAARSSEILIPNEIETTILPKQSTETSITSRNNDFRRQYATLAHPKDAQKRLLKCQSQFADHRKYASNDFQLSNNDFEYLDPLDCKIGCQTTLRSKPQIPWYELAIKKDHRRQSCPPMQVNRQNLILLLFIIYVLFQLQLRLRRTLTIFLLCLLKKRTIYFRPI